MKKCLLSHKTLSYIFLALSVSFMVACNKNKDNSTPDPTPLLTSGTWAVSDIAPSGTFAEQLSLSVLTAFEDTAYTFTNDGKFVSVDPLFALESSGTWAVSDDNKSLTMTKGDQVVKVEILSISSTQMKWNRIYTKDELQYTKDLSAIFTLIPVKK